MAASNTIALIPTDLHESRLGLASMIGDDLGGKTVLRRTVDRVARVGSVRKIVLVHPPGQDPTPLLGARTGGKPVELFPYQGGLADGRTPMRRAARKWALACWRGGLGGTTCYDELLPAGPLLAAAAAHHADAALVVGADWPLVDPGLCEAAIRRHLDEPAVMQLAFTQAPPGLAGIVVGTSLLEQIAENHTTFGQLLGYNPARPQADPIGRDVCVQVPAPVRSCTRRLVYDTPASAAVIRWVAERLGDAVTEADADAVAEALAGHPDTAEGFASLPQQVTLELTSRRTATGPVTPHHYSLFNRPDMTLATARRLVEQMGADRTTALTLGGLGDALLHEHWAEVVVAAHEAGVWGIAVETDLLVERDVVARLLDLPIDVVSVRLNADTAETYARVMGVGGAAGFERVVGHLEWLINQRNRRAAGAEADEAPGVLSRQPAGAAWGVAPERAEGPTAVAVAPAVGMPWIVPRLVKTAETLGDMETFFDRWSYYAGHAVIEPATSGCGLAPSASPVTMAPPKRFACRQLANRMTIHCDGRVALCDQDWLGRACLGDAGTSPLSELWRAGRANRAAHRQGRWDDLELCRRCTEWHRP